MRSTTAPSKMQRILFTAGCLVVVLICTMTPSLVAAEGNISETMPALQEEGPQLLQLSVPTDGALAAERTSTAVLHDSSQFSPALPGSIALAGVKSTVVDNARFSSESSTYVGTQHVPLRTHEAAFWTYRLQARFENLVGICRGICRRRQ